MDCYDWIVQVIPWDVLPPQVRCSIPCTLTSIDGKVNDVPYVTDEWSVTNEIFLRLRLCMSDQLFGRPTLPVFHTDWVYLGRFDPFYFSTAIVNNSQ